MKIIHTDAGQDGTLTANSAATSYPVDNVRHPHKTKVYRTSGVYDEWILWDFGTVTTINSIAIVNHNFISDGTVKIQGNDTNVWTAPSVDETLTYSSGVMLKYFTGGAYRYWRLHATQVGAATHIFDGGWTFDGSVTFSPAYSDPYISIGRVMIGEYWQPTKTFNYNWRDGLIDNSLINTSVDGQLYADKREQYESIELAISYAPSSDKTMLRTAFGSCGTHTNVILTLDDANPSTTSYYGRFTNMLRTSNDVNGLLSYNLTFNEAL